MQGHSAHQLARPNFAFVPVLRRSNPGCNITILTDQATQFAGLPPGVQVFRYPLDRARMGRNAWANYYQLRAQQARLRERQCVLRLSFLHSVSAFVSRFRAVPPMSHLPAHINDLPLQGYAFRMACPIVWG